MSERKPYKPTLFDRHGPAAVDLMRAFSYGLVVFSLTLSVGWAQAGFSIGLVVAAVLFGAAVYFSALAFSGAIGWTWKRFMVDGASTPYVEQYSYQQSLVMAGRLDDALESFEAVIAAQPGAIDPRVKAAELYDREKRNHRRAAELFREAQNIETIATGQYVYVTNRLVDLYTGSLNEPGRALVELRKLIDRCPGTPAAEQARAALKVLKSRHLGGM